MSNLIATCFDEQGRPCFICESCKKTVILTPKTENLWPNCVKCARLKSEQCVTEAPTSAPIDVTRSSTDQPQPQLVDTSWSNPNSDPLQDMKDALKRMKPDSEPTYAEVLRKIKHQEMIERINPQVRTLTPEQQEAFKKELQRSVGKRQTVITPSDLNTPQYTRTSPDMFAVPHNILIALLEAVGGEITFDSADLLNNPGKAVVVAEIQDPRKYKIYLEDRP